MFFALSAAIGPLSGLGEKARAAPAQRVATSRQTLENSKLQQEIIKLQLENQKLRSPLERYGAYGAIATSAVAVLGLLQTFNKQRQENLRQKELDYTQRENDRQQKHSEMQRKLEEQFANIVIHLGSESSSLQASGAVQIMGFLEPEYKQFHRQSFLILYAQLKVQHLQGRSRNRTLANLLVAAFEKAAQAQMSLEGPQDNASPIDLSRTYLYQAQLPNLNLTEADIAFADLRGADLSGSRLFRVRGYEVHMEKARLSRTNLGEARLRKAFLSEAQFHNAKLVAADLRETDLSKAEFQQASMQSAHLDHSNLIGARFEQANLNDTYFYGATFSIHALKSILNAQNWEKAHFDTSVKAALIALR